MSDQENTENKSEEKDDKKKKFSLPIHIIAVNISLFAVIILCIISIKHFLYEKSITQTMDNIKKVTEKSISSIGLQNIQSLKDSRKHMKISYFQHATLSMKEKLTNMYRANKLAAPPVIYARSEKHEDFMYILSSGRVKANPMDIYKISDPVKEVYQSKETTSMLKEAQGNGISRPTVLSIAPFKDKYGQVYGVLLLEFDVKKEMETMSRSSKIVYGAGTLIYISLLLIFNFLMKKKTPAEPDQEEAKAA